MEKVDFSFTIVVVGDSGVGKTSLITRIADKKFSKHDESTISGLMYPITVRVDDIRVRLNIWDTSGVSDYQEMNAAHFADAQGCLFLYAVDNETSLYHLVDVWKEEIDKVSCISHEFFMAGNKSDIELTICQKEINDVASQMKIENFFVSAADGSGIQELLNYITKQLIEKQAPKRLLSKMSKEGNSKSTQQSLSESIDESDQMKTEKKRKQKKDEVQEGNFCGCNVA